MSAALESSTTNVVNFSLIRFNRRQNNQKKSLQVARQQRIVYEVTANLPLAPLYSSRFCCSLRGI